MMFRLSCWPALLVAGLLVATPAFAQAPEDAAPSPEESLGEEESPADDAEEADDVDSAEDDDVDDEDEDEADEDEEAVEEDDDVDDEEQAQEPPSTTEGASEPDRPRDQDTAADDADLAEDTEQPPAAPIADDESQAKDSEDATSGLAVAPAYHSPATDVQVIGNLEEGDRWSLQLGGYLRGGYSWIQDDADFDRFGRHDGFGLHDARLTTRGQMDNGLGFVITLDAGSRMVATTADSPVDELAVRLTDGYGYYAPFEFLEFNVGQFKAPFDVEDLLSTANMLFINRAVANRGVQNIEGFNLRGLSQDRQIGVQARGTVPVFGGDDGLGVSYALAATNGNGPNKSLNENSSLAMYGRAAVQWGEMISVGGAVFRNNRTIGDAPDQIDRDHIGWTADLQVNAYGASLLANVVNERRLVEDIPATPEATSLGYQVQVAYEEPFFGFQPAYRLAFYDRYATTADDGEGAQALRDAALTYHTLGLNYNAKTYPVRLMANYTITVEDDPSRQLDNDRVDLLLQLQW